MRSARACVVGLLGVLACGSSSSSPDGGGGSGGTASTAGVGGTTSNAGTGGATSNAGTGGATSTGGTGGSVALPGAFKLERPENGTITAAAPLMFEWSASAGAAQYIVAVSADPLFRSGQAMFIPTNDTFTIVDALQPGLIYYWRVMAVNAAGDTLATGGLAGETSFWFSIPAPVGPSPHGIAVTPSGNVGVVANDASAGGLTLVDLTSFQTTTSIPLPGRPSQVAITPDGKTALATQGAPNAIAIVDLVAKKAAGSVTPPCVATTYYGLAIAADGSAAVVPDFNAGCTKDVLDVVPLPGSSIAKAIDLGTSATAFGVALTPDGKSALVTRGVTTTSIKRVDLATGTVTTIMNTSASFGVAVTPDGKKALVTSGELDTVKTIDLATNTVGAPIAFDTNQEVCNVAITPNGKYAVAVGDLRSALLSVETGEPIAEYAGAGRCVAIAPDGGRAFVTGAGASGKLFVIKLP
jgi:DNA-binding beta-propeller fold protein YncE